MASRTANTITQGAILWGVVFTSVTGAIVFTAALGFGAKHLARVAYQRKWATDAQLDPMGEHDLPGSSQAEQQLSAPADLTFAK